jgi:hypothetical protein
MQDPNVPASTEASPPQYEFTAAQSRVIGGLAEAMSWCGFVLFITGFVQAIHALESLGGVFGFGEGTWRGAVVHGVLALLFAPAGQWLWNCAASFKEVTETRGNDISHLMDALSRLGRGFRLLGNLLLLVIAVGVLALVVGLVKALF